MSHHLKQSISLSTTFPIQTPEAKLFICIHKSAAQIRKFLEKEKVTQKSIDCVMENMEDVSDNLQGFYLRTPNGLRFLYLDDYRGSWDDLDVLSHELFHFVDFEAQYRMFEKEPEFKAYLHGAVYGEIRRMLGKEVNKLITKEKDMACKIKKKKKK